MKNSSSKPSSEFNYNIKKIKEELLSHKNIINNDINNNDNNSINTFNNNPIQYLKLEIKENTEDNNVDIDKYKIKEYKNIINDLQKELENEKNKLKDKSQENKKYLIDLRLKILKYKNEIKNYSLKNEKQREKLELISEEISQKISGMNVDQIIKNLDKKKTFVGNKTEVYKNEKKVIDENIDIKERQLKNIITIIKNYEDQNEKLNNKISKSKDEKYNDELLKNIKEQEKTISELNKKIKSMKIILKEHKKCPLIKSNLFKKIQEIKNEIKLYNEKYNESKNKLTILEEKKNKPKIVLNNNINSNNDQSNKIISRNNKFSNLKKLDLNNTEINNINKQIYSIKKKKLIDSPLLKIKSNFITQKNPNKEEEIINWPENIGKFFTKKELKAISIGLDNDKSELRNILKKFKVYNTYANTIETKHKNDLKHKLNKINELDTKIEYINVKKIEIDLDERKFKELNDQNNNYLMKINKLNIQIKEQKKINEKKDEEIYILGNELIKLKKLVKNGEINSNMNEPEVEIQYIDEEEENKLFKNKGRVTFEEDNEYINKNIIKKKPNNSKYKSILKKKNKLYLNKNNNNEINPEKQASSESDNNSGYTSN